MRQKSGPVKRSAEQVVRDIRRATRRQFSAEEKIRIVLEGLRGEESIAELGRREGIASSMYHGWSKEFLETGKKRSAGDTARAATPDEVKDLRREASALKGGPGVGKTTLLDAILRVLAAKGVRILLAAPTGRAAKPMTEQTGLEARTLHRLLEIDPLHGGFRRDAQNTARLRPPGRGRNEHGRRTSHERAHQEGPTAGSAASRRGYRPATVRGPRTRPRRHHRERNAAGCAIDRGVPASRDQPHHRQRPHDQCRRDARSRQGRRKRRLLLRRGQDARRRSAKRRWTKLRQHLQGTTKRT